MSTRGRYLNGIGTFKLAINLTAFSPFSSLPWDVKGQPVPPNFLASFQNKNLAQSANGGTNGSVFDQIESLQGDQQCPW